jgi:16S rRNA (cytosine967-C5)-methyltransferase
LVLKKRVNLNACSAYKNGLVEVQDEGSQLVALETGIKAGDTVLDYCAGAGGKSLIFAQMMAGKGQIVAHDVAPFNSLGNVSEIHNYRRW